MSKKEIQKHNNIPAFIQSLFWDVSLEQVDKTKHQRFIIERILNFGRPEHIRWLLQQFSEAAIISILKKSKIIDKKTANFWALHFNINRKKILCFNKQSTNGFFK